MSHLVSPTGFRSGKTFLWDNNVNNLTNSNKILNNKINSNKGIEYTINQLLYKNNLLSVKSVSKQNVYSNKAQVKVLYYPIINNYNRKRIFPIYSEQRYILSKFGNYSSTFKNLTSKIWLLKTRGFSNRFIKTKKRKNLNIFLIKNMFKGTGIIKNFNYLPKKHIQLNNYSQSYNKTNVYTNRYKKKNFIKFFKFRKRTNKFLVNWNNSSYRISGNFFSKQLEKKIGLKVNIKLKNVFSYLASKSIGFYKQNHQDMFWNKKYKYFTKKYPLSFFNIINGFFIISKIPETENLLLKIIQHSLFKMHKRKIRPKLFFYFLDAVLKNSKFLKKEFEAFRIIITGKLRGGTARTQSFSIGFGSLPVQSFDCNIRYELGQLKSKYGSFGIKIFTWRKSRKENNKIVVRKN